MDSSESGKVIAEGEEVFASSGVYWKHKLGGEFHIEQNELF
jgi:hypothetical protein